MEVMADIRLCWYQIVMIVQPRVNTVTVTTASVNMAMVKTRRVTRDVRDTDKEKICPNVLLCRIMTFNLILFYLIYCYELEIYNDFLKWSSNTFNSLLIEFNFIENNVPEIENIITGHIDQYLPASWFNLPGVGGVKDVILDSTQ